MLQNGNFPISAYLSVLFVTRATVKVEFILAVVLIN